MAVTLGKTEDFITVGTLHDGTPPKVYGFPVFLGDQLVGLIEQFERGRLYTAHVVGGKSWNFRTRKDALAYIEKYAG
ncbi:MAG TPA: hypothetical protein VHM88_14510 [Candidatus Acidoferrales bacterium]|nr:hypothetical protein [Candidatus Acidoferrales bacterium]